ncbi:MAG: 3-methyl-2-oxobutanoate hydroxymethyltransferase [Desulfobulbaceae bacterium]|jgi:3-methyl-2-oxobutanoate hydroxymethyltransferase|nr:3-methyl-2-oxobutanoate hydroxymethyltransferase [Desulfobulbaceae bacterium]
MAKTMADWRRMKENSEKIVVVTAYDAPTARILHESGVDILLVGDSLGNAVLGYDSTVPVTMAQMLHHSAAVRRGAPEAFIVSDMPFGSYQCGWREAIANAILLMKEGGCDAVKLEGGAEVAPLVERMVTAGVPVMGHIGLTPQTASLLGGYRVQGRDLPAAKKLLAGARALQDAGVFAIVLECLPKELAALLSAQVTAPTIGIGAGSGCDGQVLVCSDMFGLYEKFVPKFVKQYVKLAPMMREATRQYAEEVRTGRYPDDEHSFTATTDYQALLEGEN